MGVHTHTHTHPQLQTGRSTIGRLLLACHLGSRDEMLPYPRIGHLPVMYGVPMSRVTNFFQVNSRGLPSYGRTQRHYQTFLFFFLRLFLFPGGTGTPERTSPWCHRPVQGVASVISLYPPFFSLPSRLRLLLLLQSGGEKTCHDLPIHS